MNKLFKFVFTLFLFIVPSANIEAQEIQEIFPTDGSTVILYDQDGFTDWDLARNYDGEIFNEPLDQGIGSNVDKVSIRSDRSQTWYRIYRHSQFFDLSLIPDGAVIQNVSLELFGTPDNTTGNTEIIVTSHQRKNESQLQKDDWPIENFGDIEFSRREIVVGEYTSYNFNESGIDYIQNSIGGSAILGLLTEYDFDNIDPGSISTRNAGFFSTEKEGQEFDPKLVIEYIAPQSPNYPLYTQTISPYPSVEETTSWADDFYAGATASSAYVCGGTIAGCGCAITSYTMLGRYYDDETDVLGSDANPGNMNAYLRSIGGYTSQGDLRWLTAAAYMGEVRSDGKIYSKFEYAHAISNPSKDVIIDLLRQEDKALLGYDNGHFVWLAGATDGENQNIIVRDPNWYNTETANDENDRPNLVRDYDDSFQSVRVIDVYDELRPLSGKAVEVHLYTKNTAELVFQNAIGEQVGYVGGEVIIDLDRAVYGDIEIINPDGNVDGAPTGKHLLVYDAGEAFTIEVIGTEVGEYSLEFFTLDEFGNTTSFAASGNTYPGVTTTFTFDPQTGEIVEEPLSAESMEALLDLVLGDLTTQQQTFFRKWIDRFFADQEDKTVSQLLQHIEVLKKLFKAKKVEHPLAPTVIDVLRNEVN